jgi:hypothetical protein
MVVGLRLGCINHALLTKLAIEAHGAEFAGWIANTIDPTMARRTENLETLTRLIGEPPLAVVPHLTGNTCSIPGAATRPAIPGGRSGRDSAASPPVLAVAAAGLRAALGKS